MVVVVVFFLLEFSLRAELHAQPITGDVAPIERIVRTSPKNPIAIQTVLVFKNTKQNKKGCVFIALIVFDQLPDHSHLSMDVSLASADLGRYVAPAQTGCFFVCTCNFVPLKWCISVNSMRGIHT